MLKKIIMTLTGVVAAVCFVSFAPVKAQAALPCTYDIINDANVNIANATANYQMAQLNHQACVYNYNLLVANGASALEIEQAAYAVNNAINIEKWWLDQVNNANAYLKNITDRAIFEDKFAENRQLIYNKTTIRADLNAVRGANDVVSGLAARIAETKSAIAGYEQQVSACPSFAAQIDALKAQLASLECEYEAKVAEANAKAATLAVDQKNLNSNYDSYFEDYQRAREEHRGDGDWEWLKALDRAYGHYYDDSHYQ